MNGKFCPQYISSGRINSRSRRCSIRSVECGQTLVEVALILPIFLVLVFAIIEIGRAWSAQQSLTLAAREGARILIMPYGPEPAYKYKSEEEVINAATDAVKASMNNSGTPAIDTITNIIPIRIRPGDDGVFNTDDDERKVYYAGISPPVVRGDRVGIYIKYEFETPAPILLRMFDNGGGSTAQSTINMGVICYMDHE